MEALLKAAEAAIVAGEAAVEELTRDLMEPGWSMDHLAVMAETTEKLRADVARLRREVAVLRSAVRS